jgi:hypothetical protein
MLKRNNSGFIVLTLVLALAFSTVQIQGATAGGDLNPNFYTTTTARTT